jgi:hypothetical protein
MPWLGLPRSTNQSTTATRPVKTTTNNQIAITNDLYDR